MSARTEFTKRQVFAVMWHKAKEDADDPNTVPVIEWLKYVAWDELFPGHCFRCHGFEDGPCHTEDGGYHECPGCREEDAEHKRAALLAAMPPPIEKQRVIDMLNDYRGSEED